MLINTRSAANRKFAQLLQVRSDKANPFREPLKRGEDPPSQSASHESIISSFENTHGQPLLFPNMLRTRIVIRSNCPPNLLECLRFFAEIAKNSQIRILFLQI
jgi:hypothetical protein